VENPYSAPKSKLEKSQSFQVNPEDYNKYLTWAIIHGTIFLGSWVLLLFSLQFAVLTLICSLYNGMKFLTYFCYVKTALLKLKK